jgi:hypothetical protein
MVLDVSITHPCGGGNQPWVRQTAADARHVPKHQRLRDYLQHAEEQFGQGTPDGLVFMPAVFETYDLCDLHSQLHLHDAADRCAMPAVPPPFTFV